MTAKFSKFARIPSLPTVAIEALKLFHDANSSNDDLVSVIRKDPAMVCKLLKAANSAKYAPRPEVTDLNRAVILMGRAAASSLVLSFSLATQSMEPSQHLEHYRRFWTRSFVQATAAELLASQFGSQAFRSECYTTSILSGLGKLAMLKAEPGRYLACLQKSAQEGIPLPRVELDVFGFSHSALSAFLLQQMGLPDRCHLAIRGVADPDSSRCSARQPLLMVTQLADAIASLLCDETPAIALIHLEEGLAAIQLPNQMTAVQVVDSVRDQLTVSAQLFEISPPQLPSASDLLEDALDQLSRIATMGDDYGAPTSIPAELLEENGRLKRRVADLLHFSRVDSLTGLCNRAHLLQELSERAALHRLRGLRLGMAVIDIDHFKKINDTYGHQAGDAALKSVAETLRAALRDTDLIGRYGGEEFVAILEDADPSGLAIVGERLRSKVEKAIVIYEGTMIPVTVSVGLAEGYVIGSECEFGERLLATADAAMYRAKNAGRNRYMVDSLCTENRGNADPSGVVESLCLRQ